MVAPSHVTTGAHPHHPRRWTARTTGSHSVKYSLADYDRAFGLIDGPVDGEEVA